MKMSAWKFLLPGVIVCVLAGSAVAQQLYIYPARGQSQAKQEQDTYECSSWAVQQTGINQTVPPPVPQPSAPPPPGLFGGAFRGAALGSVGGAIGGNAGEGAAVGAVVGGLFGADSERTGILHDRCGQDTRLRIGCQWHAANQQDRPSRPPVRSAVAGRHGRSAGLGRERRREQRKGELFGRWRPRRRRGVRS